MNEDHEPAAAPEPGDAGSLEETDAGSAETAAGAGADEEERLRHVMEELRRLRVEDLALDMAVSLVTVGYQKLGLTEQTRELRDLDGARLSIELLRATLDVLERERGASGLGDLRGTLSAMQLNYARVVADEQADAQPRSDDTAETGDTGNAPGADAGTSEDGAPGV
jgi:hypothetical protein